MKKIVVVGGEIPGKLESIDFKETSSIADADIIIIFPTISAYDFELDGQYMGKPSLSDSGSGKYMDVLSHWRFEIASAIEAGKTMFLISEKPEFFYFATGEKTYSGTGRNQKVTRIVDKTNSYDMFKGIFTCPRPSGGQQVKFKAKTDLLKPIWEVISPYVNYECLYKSEDLGLGSTFFQMKGTGVVGGLIRFKTGASLICLPAIDLNGPSFAKEENGKYFWSEKANIFGAQFTKALVSLEKSLKSSSETTAPPSWSLDGEYQLETVVALKQEVLKVSKAIHDLESERVSLEKKIGEEQKYNGLLFEKGPALEKCIIECLEKIGIKAKNFRDEDSEFDLIFEEDNTTFVGEVEGKDSGHIDVKKISQLIRNIGECLSKDFARDSVKGILFGNGFRLTDPKSRKEQFTDKCIKAAEQHRIELVRTCDLFQIVINLAASNDKEYIKECRKALLTTEAGIVRFPEPGNKTKLTVSKVATKKSPAKKVTKSKAAKKRGS